MIRILSVIVGFLLSSGLAHAVPITDVTGLNGLERANQVADEHGQQGRDNATFHHATSLVQNGSFMTHPVALLPSTKHGATVDSPTTGPGGNPPAMAVPEPTSLLLLGSGLLFSSGLVGLVMWHSRKRKALT